MESDLIDFKKIKEFLGDDKDVFISFYSLFREQTDIDIKELEKFIQEKNWTEVSGLAHKIKSFYGNIGSVSAYNVLASIEKGSKDIPDSEKIIDLQKQYIEIHGKIIEEIDNYITG